ncbi:hypothetical protein BJV85_000027 [Clostridium acetobutylicum]|uniref:DUF2508 domain-containing protein n=1 Tax=Clostridium acetobutylicum (strain ATCC 824 / DSM 792 / JCM 1419 / IAM 19013 / LMG 5710 / NBRC 13948 / NRRL B-527 / VKM B-1787 / 2291 / W) TaxID=272562 RepID=Q97MR3_CLOAB|nr:MULTISPECIES: YaaL family protein [Clostridium]AAK78113.1 Hypothetical protein CA_C0128 [Clostridium acetobutylicum ATCC 824]ADZ19172.1 Conserved hypothetical protein [Clostridium acetobutylicum EA 2018]AEI31068.1 hypothetical protein SMB_G0129 [Clostridium acetobutylicum DSM 1731]AWV81825.1 DUF2508 family protein [Clostridium acetobutylicum]KHD35015.1 hypothetical protein NL50_15290 [Clostridium acetobutylicum]
MKKNMSDKGSGFQVDVQSLILEIEQARREMQNCMNYFQNVGNEPNLIDYAIYKEAAARAKYMYLLTKARKLNVKVNRYDFNKKMSS